MSIFMNMLLCNLPSHQPVKNRAVYQILITLYHSVINRAFTPLPVQKAIHHQIAQITLYIRTGITSSPPPGLFAGPEIFSPFNNLQFMPKQINRVTLCWCGCQWGSEWLRVRLLTSAPPWNGVDGILAPHQSESML